MDGARWTFDGKPVRWSWMHREAARAMGMRAGFISEDELVEIRTTDPQSGEEVTVQIWPDFESDALLCIYVGLKDGSDLWAIKRDPKREFKKFVKWVEETFGGGATEDLATNEKKAEAVRTFMLVMGNVQAADFVPVDGAARDSDDTDPAPNTGGGGDGEAEDPFGNRS